MAVIYKTSWLSWFLAKYFLNISFISIVNILNKTKLVEEFLQTRAKPKVIAKYVIENLNSHSKINYMPVLDSLTQKNVYQNTAKHIIAFKL
jgi:lipid A disaccharide synthetase